MAIHNTLFQTIGYEHVGTFYHYLVFDFKHLNHNVFVNKHNSLKTTKRQGQSNKLVLTYINTF